MMLLLVVLSDAVVVSWIVDVCVVFAGADGVSMCRTVGLVSSGLVSA